MRKLGDTERALELYLKSRAVAPSVPNTLNAAVCLRELGRFDEALELYEDLVTKFRDEITAEERTNIAAEMTSLRTKVGSIDVQANVEGALVIDGRSRGSLPLLGPVRVLPGQHMVTVVKEGYASHQAPVDVKVGETATVQAKLEPLAAAGRMKLADPALEGAEVFVDGAPVGKVPWEGPLAPGVHVLFVRKGDDGSAPMRVVLVQGQVATPSVKATALGPEMRIVTKPSTAAITIGDVPVGTGRWQGRLPLGAQVLEVSEDGYFPDKRSIDVGPKSAGNVEIELKVDESNPRWGVTDAGFAWLEVFGGFAIAPRLGTGAEKSCGSADCGSNPAALGLLVGARGGWEFPIRLSIEIAAGYFRASKTLERSVPSTLLSGEPLTFSLTDKLTVSGPFAGAGLAYRLPFADIFEFRAHLLVGALFTFAGDDVSGSVSDGSEQMAVAIEGSGQNVSSADLFLMHGLALGLSLDQFRFGIEATGAYFALGGPASKKGAARGLEPCGSNPASLACRYGDSSVVASEAAYGPFFTIVPSLYAGYAF